MSESRPERRPSKVVYRKCSFTPDPGGHLLEDAIRTALLHQPVAGGKRLCEDWHLRRLDQPFQDGSDAACLLLNHMRDPSSLSGAQSFLYGELVSFRPGSSAPFLSGLEGQAELDVNVIPAPRQGQFLDPMTFWLISGNHVLVINGPNARRRNLEDYLRWLLRQPPGLLPADRDIALVDRLIVPKGRTRNVPIKSITIGGRAGNSAMKTVVTDTVEDVEKVGPTRSAGRAWVRSLLDTVFGDSARTERLLEELPDDQDILVKVVLGFRRKRRSIENVPMKDVAEMVRNLDDADLSFETAKGSIRGEEMRLSHPVQVATINGLLDREDVLRALAEAFHVFVSNGFLEGE